MFFLTIKSLKNLPYKKNVIFVIHVFIIGASLKRFLTFEACGIDLMRRKKLNGAAVNWTCTMKKFAHHKNSL